ncbi:MAG: helix-turn-helix domain-containing protein [Armatimonadetes bacterium]|nr:helix-turn-helix domain-containing protein [Armatimonadota bacterium]
MHDHVRTRRALSDILTTKEAAAYLRTTPDTIRRLLRQRRMPAMKLGGAWRLRKGDLDEMFTETLVDETLVQEAERRRAASEGTVSLAEVKERLGL